MITLDIATASNTFIVTLKELSVTNNPVYRLQLYNFYTGINYLWYNLSSISNERKDIITLTFSNEFMAKSLEVGQYKYTFAEYTAGFTASSPTYSVVEVGMCKVINTNVTNGEIFIQPTETDDDYITI